MFSITFFSFWLCILKGFLDFHLSVLQVGNQLQDSIHIVLMIIICIHWISYIFFFYKSIITFNCCNIDTDSWVSLVTQWEKIHLHYRRCRFDPWVRKIPWRRAWQPTPVFLPGKSHFCQKISLTGLQSMGSQRVRHEWSNWACTRTQIILF